MKSLLILQEVMAVPVAGVLMLSDRLAIAVEVRIYCTFASCAPSYLKAMVEGGLHNSSRVWLIVENPQCVVEKQGELLRGILLALSL